LLGNYGAHLRKKKKTQGIKLRERANLTVTASYLLQIKKIAVKEINAIQVLGKAENFSFLVDVL
jgi:hypothetical protein